MTSDKVQMDVVLGAKHLQERVRRVEQPQLLGRRAVDQDPAQVVPAAVRRCPLVGETDLVATTHDSEDDHREHAQQQDRDEKRLHHDKGSHDWQHAECAGSQVGQRERDGGRLVESVGVHALHQVVKSSVLELGHIHVRAGLKHPEPRLSLDDRAQEHLAAIAHVRRDRSRKENHKGHRHGIHQGRR